MYAKYAPDLVSLAAIGVVSLPKFMTLAGFAEVTDPRDVTRNVDLPKKLEVVEFAEYREIALPLLLHVISWLFVAHVLIWYAAI
jgi:hypothetical protein